MKFLEGINKCHDLQLGTRTTNRFQSLRSLVKSNTVSTHFFETKVSHAVVQLQVYSEEGTVGIPISISNFKIGLDEQCGVLNSPILKLKENWNIGKFQDWSRIWVPNSSYSHNISEFTSLQTFDLQKNTQEWDAAKRWGYSETVVGRRRRR